jgi:hypothetical protein
MRIQGDWQIVARNQQLPPRMVTRDRVGIAAVNGRRPRRRRTARFAITFDPVRFALADSLRFLANCLDPRRGTR